jgi:hypothetical protein
MRFFYTVVLGMSAISLASAGQIEIGAGQNGSGVSTLGLTAAYIGSTTWAEKNYVTNLFTSDTLTSSAPLPTAGNGLQQFTDPNNGVTFAMETDGGTGATTGDNYWASPATAGTAISSSISVPVGVSDASSAFILLSDYYGLAGQVNNDTVEFIFNGGAVTASVGLANGTDIASVHDCLAPNSAAVTPKSCPTIFSGTTTSSNTDIAWSGTYAEANNATPFSGTSGNASLLDLTFDLTAFSGDTLNSIVITDNNNLTMSSRLALSAVTVAGSAVVTSVTPEPSTMLLLLAGLGAIAFLGTRRKARS